MQLTERPLLHMGIDIGSTTIKVAAMDGEGQILYSRYRRHHADIRGEIKQLFDEIASDLKGRKARISMTGSAGLGLAKGLGIPFMQEVIAGTAAVNRFIPDADVVIELGGEDAKITYMKPVVSQRMNGTCAGGTGAFIDQMATLLQTDPAGLNELAGQHKTIYTIASRCGVFAKSDVQPLLNEGAAREDLAASVFQAVVNQTIAGLSCGQPITGKVVFLGGPLYFLSQLRACFEDTLRVKGCVFTMPEHAQYFVAIGAALSAEGLVVSLEQLPQLLRDIGDIGEDIPRLQPLFQNELEKKAFYLRHEQDQIQYAPLAEYQGPCFLGFDAGSTTIKAVLTGRANEVLYTYYQSNNGNPILVAVEILKEIYAKLPKGAYLANTCATGYGEALLKTALNMDMGEIETLAHFKAAKYFAPDVDFIVDIGGQDMKCMHIKEGVIDSIMLNEACSSGCGSFLQTFAGTLGMSIEELSHSAMESRNPVDLGTRCTVFMNSRVKQAQKEGADVSDIAAGLAYSVIRNALYKVIKLKSPEDMGRKIIVQGGTFYNDSVLRCFERVSERKVIRPSIAGLMGAFGASLLAAEHYREKASSTSSIISRETLEKGFTMETETSHCKNCANRCKLTTSVFNGGRKLVSGNRCERGEGVVSEDSGLPNLFDFKYKRVFRYKPLTEAEADRGTIGIPRALNMYEDYPFWFTLLTKLGFRVILSERSSHKVFEKGMDSISSESVCYPAKLAHGHVASLVEKGIGTIFFPCIPYEIKENKDANNHFNCPIVTSYPEVLLNNMDVLKSGKVRFMHPFLSLAHGKRMVTRIVEEFSDYGVTLAEAKEAVAAAYAELEVCKREIREKGREVIDLLDEKGITGIVLAGRPYHIDPEINHGIPQMINSLGFAVLTEDSIAYMGRVKRPLRVVDQWMYHTRLYDAAAKTARSKNLELVQLNSFGCGLDAVTIDQVAEILENAHGIYTVLKIDEINNLGAARIRMRSLKVAIQERREQGKTPRIHTGEGDYTQKRMEFTKAMKEKHTIIAPQMSPIHFKLVNAAFVHAGYRLKVLEQATPEDVEVGLRYVNNDACYPTIMVVGQLVNALLTGGYDPKRTSVLITQTGGGCRATNYIAFLRKALKSAGLEQVPVISLNALGMEKNAGFKFSLPFLDKALKSLLLGDLLQTLLLRVRPYEKRLGAAQELYEHWLSECEKHLAKESKYSYKGLVDAMVKAFDALPLFTEERKPRVGIVGEILVKYHPDANNQAVNVIENEGCEAAIPGMMGFFEYCLINTVFKEKTLGTSKKTALFSKVGLAIIKHYSDCINARLGKSMRFEAGHSIWALADKAKDILSLCNNSGEGWLLTAEMIALIEEGIPNILCVQPFACLPNHVTGKGMIKELRRRFPQANIVPVDYDPGASQVNQINRIKLMVSTAFHAHDRSGLEYSHEFAPAEINA